MNEKWFALSIKEIEKKLKTNAALGLSRKAARSAWHKGFSKTQALFLRRKKSISKMLCETIGDFSVVILILAAVFAMLFDEISIGATVLSICAIGLAVSFTFYVKSQRLMEQMNLYFTPTAKVIRGGKLYRVSFENVVPGDVIIVEKGDIVCADARLVTSDSLQVAMRIDKKSYIQRDSNEK